jgi:hypothetical protein
VRVCAIHISIANSLQPYHTDAGDILSLYALGQAYKGGKTKLASMGAIYNELAKTRPDRITTLQSPEWIFDSCVHIFPRLLLPLKKTKRVIDYHSTTSKLTKKNNKKQIRQNPRIHQETDPLQPIWSPSIRLLPPHLDRVQSLPAES